MKWLARLVRKITNTNQKNPDPWFVEWVRGESSSDSGMSVNGRSALQWAPLWYGINKIAGHVSQMPCELRERTSAGTSRLVENHASYWLLNWQPNEFMTPSVFREVMQHHAILWGNARAYIERNDRREPSELIILPPDRTATVRINGEKFHVFNDPETQQDIRFRDNDVLHIVGFGYDGLQGFSLIEFARNSIGMGLAAEKHVNRHFKNNAVPSMVLEAPPGMFRTEQDAEEFMRRWRNWHEGLDNTNKVGMLREGMKVTPLGGMSGRDAQWLEERQFQRQEAALWLLLEQILGDGVSVSYNSLEQKNLGYLVNCLMRWLIKWEEELARKMLTRTQFESGRYYWKFKTAALLRGTTKERYEVYDVAIRNRILNPNEVRELEDLPPYEGGDEYGNPAITPSRQQEPTDAESPEEDTGESDTTGNSLAENAIASRIDVLARLEQQRIQQGAEKHGRKFLNWIDQFYTGFTPRFEEMLANMGAPHSHAKTWADESIHRLVECAGNATVENLPIVVAAELSSWPQRTKELAKVLTCDISLLTNSVPGSRPVA